MKNTAITPEPSAERPLDAGWRSALALLEQDLRRRGAAEKTRHAYAVDARQFVQWAGSQRLAPTAVTPRLLRRYAASLTEAAQAPTTVARKLASLRALFRSLVEHGVLEQNPADLLSAPRRGERLPRVLKAAEVAALLDRIPADTALALRDRALFELAYASGLRAEELVKLDLDAIDWDAERVRVEGKGGKTRLVPTGEPALQAIDRYLKRGRPARVGAAGGGRRGRLAACAAALVRDASARRRGRSALDPGAARARLDLYDSGLHSGRVRAVEIGLRT